MRHHALPNPESVAQRVLKAIRAGARTAFDIEAHMPDVSRLAIANTLHSLNLKNKVTRGPKVANKRGGPREVSTWTI